VFDLKRQVVTFANSGLPFPIRISGNTAEQIALPGLPLGSFGASVYDELNFQLQPGDVFVFCSDGISETFSERGEEFGSPRVMAIAREHRDKPAKEIVSAIFGAVQAFRGTAEQTDDQTVVVVKIGDGKNS